MIDQFCKGLVMPSKVYQALNLNVRSPCYILTVAFLTVFIYSTTAPDTYAPCDVLLVTSCPSACTPQADVL